MKKYIFVITIALSLCLTACGGAETQSAAEASMEEAVKSDSSEKGALAIDGITTDEVMSEITSDGIVEKLISFGMTEDEANEGASILRQCGVPSIDICEPTDSNATIDGLVSYRGKVDNDRIYWFTVEGRRIFYVGFNGEDLYDEDMIRYEDEEIFDDQGNYLETKRNTIVTMREVERFIFIKKKRPVDQRGRLFPKCSDDKKEEIKNEQ